MLINTASLQIEHELTASAQQAKVNFWDTSIPNQQLDVFSNSADTELGWRCRHPHQHVRGRPHRCRHDGLHEPDLHGNRDYARWWWGICGGRSEGDAYMLQPHNNVLVPTNGSGYSITFTHTPSDSQSHLNLTFTAIWKIFTANSGDDGEWLIQIEVDGSAVGGTLLRTIGTSETGSSSPCIGQYTNSSLSAKTIPLELGRRDPQTTSLCLTTLALTELGSTSKKLKDRQ